MSCNCLARAGAAWSGLELGKNRSCARRKKKKLGAHAGREVCRAIRRLELESTSPEVKEGRLKELDQRWKEERRKKNRERGKRKWEEKREKKEKKKGKRKYAGLGSGFCVIRFFC